MHELVAHAAQLTHRRAIVRGQAADEDRRPVAFDDLQQRGNVVVVIVIRGVSRLLWCDSGFRRRRDRLRHAGERGIRDLLPLLGVTGSQF